MYTDEQKEKAKILYLQGNEIPEISDAMKIGRRTLYAWSKSSDWNKAANRDDTFYAIKQRIAVLLLREKKTAPELKELDNLLFHLEKLENLKIRTKYTAEAAGDGSGGKKRGRKKAKNDFTEIDEEQLLEKFKEGLFDYQLRCGRSGTHASGTS